MNDETLNYSIFKEYYLKFCEIIRILKQKLTLFKLKSLINTENEINFNIKDIL